MSVKITVTEPTTTDNRYLFTVDAEKTPGAYVFPTGFARANKDGKFDFWTGFGSQDYPLPEKGEYVSIEQITDVMSNLIKTQTPEDRAWRVLSRLAGALSPENLSCDGELRGAKLITKRRRLLKEWAEQEKVLGRKVTEDDVWQRTYSAA